MKELELVKQLHLTDDGRVAIITAIPRNLHFYTSEGKHIRTIPGGRSKREDPDYPYIRWGNVNDRIIWHSSPNSLSVVDCKSYEEVTFQKIFTLPIKNRNLKPSIVLPSTDGSSIFSMAFDGNTPLLINYCLPGTQEYLAIPPKISLEISTWSCGVRSLDQNFVLIGGVMGDSGVVVCLKLSNLTTVHSVLKPIPSSSGSKSGSAKQATGRISELARLSGSDLYLAASLNDVFCFKLLSGELKVFLTIPTPGEKEVYGLSLVTDGLYLMRPTKEIVEFVGFGRSFDEFLMFKSKHTEESKFRSTMEMRMLNDFAEVDNGVQRDQNMTKITCVPADERLTVDAGVPELRARSLSPIRGASPQDSNEGSLSTLPDPSMMSLLAKLIETPKDTKTPTAWYSGAFFDAPPAQVHGLFDDTDYLLHKGVPRSRICATGETTKVLALAGTTANCDIYEKTANGLIKSKGMSTSQPAHSLQGFQGQYIAMQEMETNNLHVLNTANNSTRVLVGQSRDSVSRLASGFEVRNTEQRGVILCKHGDDSVALVALDNPDTPLQVINGFWNSEAYPLSNLVQITLLLKQKPEKILGLALFDDKQYILRSHDLNKGKSKTLLLSAVLQDLIVKLANQPESSVEQIGFGTSLHEVISIDNSNGTNKFFLACVTNEASAVRKTILCELKITNEGIAPVMASIITNKTLRNPRRFVSVTVPSHPVEFVLLFGENSTVVLSAEDKSFAVIHIIQNLCGVSWLGCSVLKDSLYCVSNTSNYMMELFKSAKSTIEVQETDESATPGIESTLKNDRSKYSKYTVEPIKIAKELNKYCYLAVDTRTGILYIAGNGVQQVCDIFSVSPKLGHSSSTHFISLRYCESSKSLMGIEANTFDFLELNGQNLAELRRYKGTGGMQFEREDRRDIRHSADANFVPWLQGNGDLAIISLKDLSIQDRPKFFVAPASDSQAIVPLLCVTSKELDRIFGVAVCSDEGGQLYSFQDSKAQAFSKITSLAGLIAKGFVFCAETIDEQAVLLVGGSTVFDFQSSKSEAVLAAYTFDKKLSYITDLKIDERDNRFVSKIRRIPDTNRFFAATIDMIYVYEFKNRKFYKLSVIENVSKSVVGITDMVYHKNTLYAFTAGDSEISRIEFASY